MELNVGQQVTFQAVALDEDEGRYDGPGEVVAVGPMGVLIKVPGPEQYHWWVPRKDWESSIVIVDDHC